MDEALVPESLQLIPLELHTPSPTAGIQRNSTNQTCTAQELC